MQFLKSIPPILYKYRDWSDQYQKRLLTEGEIYFASADQFNDPFDCSIPFRFNEEDLTEENLFRKYLELGRIYNPDMNETALHNYAFKAQRRDLIHDENHLRQTDETFAKRFNKEWGILSLTSKNDNFLMWSHYAHSHSGFCIGLDSDSLYKQILGTLGPVVYATNFPEFGLFEESNDSMIKQTYHKSKIWEYEDEYRVLKNGYARKVVKLNSGTIKEIIFGAKMQQSDKFNLLKMISEKYPQAGVYELKMHDSKFELVKISIR